MLIEYMKYFKDTRDGTMYSIIFHGCSSPGMRYIVIVEHYMQTKAYAKQSTSTLF